MNVDYTKTGQKHEDVPDEQFDQEQLRMGIEVEKEHTDDPEEAKEIAKDHLVELPDYYTRLKKMEAEAEKELGKKGAYFMARGYCEELGKLKFAAKKDQDFDPSALTTAITLGTLGGGAAGVAGEMVAFENAIDKIKNKYKPSMKKAPTVAEIQRIGKEWRKALNVAQAKILGRTKYTVPAAAAAGALLGTGGYVGYKKLRKRGK